VRSAIGFILVVAAVIFFTLAFYLWWSDYHPQLVITRNAFLVAAAEHANDPLALGVRTKTSGCLALEGLPDSDCTPGAVFASATPAVICVSGYTKTVRNVSVATKRLVYQEYGLSYPQPSGAYEADHLIPLELGGNNEIANLFPEAAEPTPGFHEKDLVENYLHNKVCDGNITLAFAQQQIATNWKFVYDNLTPSEIYSLKLEFSQ
jgi:hypothetical protein